MNFYVTALIYTPCNSSPSPREVYCPLAGPFPTREAAESAVPLARQRMTDADETLHFTPVGVTRMEITMRVVFPDITEQTVTSEPAIPSDSSQPPAPAEPRTFVEMICHACFQSFPAGSDRRFPEHSDPQSPSTVYRDGRVYRTPCRMSNTFYPESQW